jgi:hypothetical protein
MGYKLSFPSLFFLIVCEELNCGGGEPILYQLQPDGVHQSYESFCFPHPLFIS